jgi:hypothetical protein
MDFQGPLSESDYDTHVIALACHMLHHVFVYMALHFVHKVTRHAINSSTDH